MKQKGSTTSQKNQKWLAIFLAATMFLSIFMIYFSGSSNTNAGNNEDPVSGEDQIPKLYFSQIPGKQVMNDFYSISDALKMSPNGLVSARYIDLQKMEGTPLEEDQSNRQMLNNFYGTEVTKRYTADYLDGSGFELHQIPEQQIIMPFNATLYEGYQLLARTNGTYDIWNVVGNPVILGPQASVKNAIDVLEGNSTSAAEDFDYILTQIDSNGALYQEVVKRTPFINIPAEQWYKDLKKLDDGSYSQTTVFLNPDENLTKQINVMETNASERGVRYDVTSEGNITKLMITADFNSLNNETAMLMA